MSPTAALAARPTTAGITAAPTPAEPDDERALWSLAGGIAFAIHAAAIGAVLFAVVPTEPPVPEPVVLVELPPEAAPAPAVAAAQPVTQPQPEYVPPQVITPPVKVPPVSAPLPRDPVVLPPPPPPAPARRAALSPAEAPAAATTPAVAATGSGPGTSTVPGNDPKAQKLEADYKSLVASHIRRNKFSPPQSRKAGISGSVKVRFVVHRSGAITDVGVAGSSGEPMLDGEAIAFLQRLSPVPSFPRDLHKAEIPLTITLKFALESK